MVSSDRHVAHKGLLRWMIALVQKVIKRNGTGRTPRTKSEYIRSRRGRNDIERDRVDRRRNLAPVAGAFETNDEHEEIYEEDMIEDMGVELAPDSPDAGEDYPQDQIEE